MVREFSAIRWTREFEQVDGVFRSIFLAGQNFNNLGRRFENDSYVLEQHKLYVLSSNLNPTFHMVHMIWTKRACENRFNM